MLQKFISSFLILTILFSDFLIIFADETGEIINIPTELTESWATNPPTLTEIINPIPNIIITLQSPSYLTDKDSIQDIYHCDTLKSECKVNFDLSDTFWWYVPAKFACLNNFSFITWDENKCNPNTIIFPVWTFLVNFKIYEKDNTSNFKEKNITIVNEIEQNKSETGSLEESWGIIDSGSSPEWQSGSSGWQQETNSWSIDSGTWELSLSWSSIIDPETIPVSYPQGYRPTRTEGSPEWQMGSSWSQNNWISVPNVDIEIQSWLELVDWNYKCKNTDCKINLNLENLFTWSYDISNYTCLWDFWSGTFTTIDTDKKCNPGYVNYGTWNFSIEAKISEKNNPTNFKTWNLSFYNWELPISINYWTWELSESWSSFIDPANLSSGWQSESSEWQSESSEWQSNTSTGSFLLEIVSNNLEIPNVDIEVQSWLEFINWSYKCKNIDCKINLNLENLFTWSYDISDYSCEWDFWSGTFITLDTDKKCNPGYVNYWIWRHYVEAKIIEKNNPNNFKTWSLNFENEISLIQASSSSSTTNSLWNNFTEQKKEIIIQSGASKIWENTYKCNEEKCKINMQYENSSNETCFWDFWWWIYKETYTKTCNPSFVYYYSWNYKIRLNIYKNWLFSEEKSITLTNNFFDNAKIYNLYPTAKIKLQWTIWKNKELIWNKLICKNTKECSVNFDWSESTDPNKDNLEFFWDFWNWKFEEKANPSTIKYSPWKYKVKLKVTDRFWEYSEDYFFIEVYEKEQEVLKLNENITKYIKIIEALPNPVWSEENEWIKIKNDSINFINIKWLEIDDKIWEWSKVYTIKDDFYLLPYGEKKLYKVETKLNLNNSFDEVNLIYNNTIIDSLVWNYEVPEWFVVKKELREKVKILNVIDWDTIVIQFKDGTKEHLRFIWVDTPETKHPKKAIEFYWKETSDFTKKNLEWKEIELELDFDNYRDKYGRLLGYVWIDNINFNKLLIEKWYGRAYLYFPFKYSAEFAKAEKEAKKNKLWLWWDEEVRKEIEELEKLEKKENIENIKFQESISFDKILTNISNLFDKENYKELILNKNFFSYFSLWIDQKEIQKENLKEFDLLLSDLLKSDKKTTKSNIKQEKILSYKTSKLKSGLKITWVTFPNSLVTLSFDEIKLETKSNEIWNYTFLITDNLKVGDYELQFLVSNWWQDYPYLAPRSVNLSKDYIFWVQDYKLKQLNKKVKKKKAKKAKKKKLVAKKSTLKKMKYDIKDIKKEEDKSASSKNIFLIFLLSLLVSIMWFFLIKKVD